MDNESAESAPIASIQHRIIVINWIESESERTRVSLAKVLVAVQERHSPEESGSEELHKTMQDARTYAHTM